MTLQMCYAAMGGDYEGVLGRLRSERLIEKFALKFLDDKCYDELCTAMEAQDAETAFRAAHTLKGVGLNLGFTALGDSSSRLTESVRNGWSAEAPALMEEVRGDYQRVMEALRVYREEKNG